MPGKLRLYIKGADSVILPRLTSKTDPTFLKKTQADLERFSAEGLRTLVLGYADLDEIEYEQWALRYKAASNAIGNRKKKMEEVGAEIEKNIELIGVSAIEDALQVGVPDTLNRLRRAGIKVWVLTGDKQGTAVNIGKSCGLIDTTHEIRYLTGTNRGEVSHCRSFQPYSIHSSHHALC